MAHDFANMTDAKLRGYIVCALRQVDPNYDRINAAREEYARRG